MGAIRLIMVVIILGLIPTKQAKSASQDECAIWLCLPGGFPDGCGAAKSALYQRIKRLKPPLPAFGACAVNPQETAANMNYAHGVAAYVPEHQVCVKKADINDDIQCVKFQRKPAEYIKGQACETDHEGDQIPRGCSRTFRYVEVYLNGELAGPTYYW